MKSFVIFVVGIVVVVLGVTGVRSLNSDGAPAYITAPVERGNVVTYVTATGKLKPVGEVKVGSQMSGQIESLLVDFNDRLKQGQTLARLDDAILSAKMKGAQAAVDVALSTAAVKESAIRKAEAELTHARDQVAILQARTASAQAAFDEARRDLESKISLYRSRTISRRALDQATATHHAAAANLRAAKLQQQAQASTVLAAESLVEIARAEHENAKAVVRERQARLEEARIEIERMVITSPIDGVVIGRDVERGQTVAATLEAPTLFTLAEDLRKMEVHAKVDEADIGRIRADLEVVFTVDAFPDKTFTGRVRQIRKAPADDQGVVTYTVVIRAENPDELLLPGMTAFVRVIVAQVSNVMKVPNAALRFRPQTMSTHRRPPPTGSDAAGQGSPAVVWVIGDDARPASVPIRIGAADQVATEVVAGALAVGQPVIVGVASATPSRLTFFGIPIGL
jgi:HlyD family secretion protein